MNQNYAQLLECIHCHKQYPIDSVEYTCPDCGASGNLTVIYDYASIKKDWSKKI